MAADDLLCRDCIDDEVLRAKIDAEGDDATCSFCGGEARCCSIDWLADLVDDVMRDNYYPAPDSPHVVDWSDNIQYWQDGETVEDILGELLGAEPQIIEALVEELSEREAHDVQDGADALYGDSPLQHVRTVADPFFDMWMEFEERVKHKVRFFDAVGRQILDELFGDLANIAQGRAIVTLNPGEEFSMLFRARVVDNEASKENFILDPAKEIGPPPPFHARPGRMNPAGIAAFYGAFSADVALAEIRPAVGSMVAIAQFVPLRALRLLDMTFLPFAFHEQSIFSPDYQRLRSKVKFLAAFHRHISRPVLPTDEMLGYIPTQAVAAYVSNVMGLDGIIYSSIQVGADGDAPIDEPVDRPKCNIVLFGEAAQVEATPPPADRAPNCALRIERTNHSPKLVRVSGVTVGSSAIFAHLYDDGTVIVDEFEDHDDD